MPHTQPYTKSGALIALVGAIVALVVFFAVPIILTAQQSLTLWQIVTNARNTNQNGLFLLAALVPLATSVLATSILRGTAKKESATWLVIASLFNLALVVYFYALFVTLGTFRLIPLAWMVQLSSMLGTGFWVYAFAAILSLGGSLIQARAYPARF